MNITKETKGNKTITTLSFDSKEDGIVNEYDMLEKAGTDNGNMFVDNPSEIGYGKGIIKNVSLKFDKQPNKIIKLLFSVLVIIIFILLLVIPFIFYGGSL